MKEYYKTELGKLYLGKCEDIIRNLVQQGIKVNLIITSPPFPLSRSKRYGNMTGERYIEWMDELADLFKSILTEDGSIVIEMGNAWEKGLPVHSTLPIESLLEMKHRGEFYLCQEFIHYNPAALPAPIEWVNKKRIRVKDSFTRIWWMSVNPMPNADNRKVLTQYSKQMEKLIRRQKYNSGRRPSEYVIGESSFNHDNGGAIPSNVIIASNTVSSDPYLKYCKKNGYEIHPARMVKEIPEFFIKFLTDEDDLVLDPFAGSNMTGMVAEHLKRRWIGIEVEQKYAEGSKGRFWDESE